MYLWGMTVIINKKIKKKKEEEGRTATQQQKQLSYYDFWLTLGWGKLVKKLESRHIVKLDRCKKIIFCEGTKRYNDESLEGNATGYVLNGNLMNS